MPQFLNKFKCQACAIEWQDEWSCACDDCCPNCEAPHTPYESTIIGIEGLKTFEIEASGFTGDGSTDDRIVWVAASSESEVAAAIEGLGAKVCTMDVVVQDTIDFVLPADIQQLRFKLSAFAGLLPWPLGLSFSSNGDEIDDDHLGRERTTPAGSEWIVNSFDEDVKAYSLTCDKTGGWIFATADDLRTDFSEIAK